MFHNVAMFSLKITADICYNERLRPAQQITFLEWQTTLLRRKNTIGECKLVSIPRGVQLH